MKKLSEIGMDEHIALDDYDVTVLTKEDFLEKYCEQRDDKYYWDDEPIKIYTGKPITVVFDWVDAVHHFSSDTYDGWEDDVISDIEADPEIIGAIRKVQRIFDRYPVYYQDELIFNDMILEVGQDG